VDVIRSRRRRREEAVDDARLTNVPDAGDSSPEARTASREIADGIRHCLAGLVEHRRLAVTLHLQGHTVPEVASILRWQAKKAENLVYRGLADLRRCLATKGLAR
jgi:RNA polymerase sigma-70 factor (ECF subfamily)